MKKLVILFSFVLFGSCGISEECLKSTGAMTTKEVYPDAVFENIYVYPGVALVLTEGDEYAITIEAGANFIDDVEVTIADNALRLKDNSGCNLVRDYGQTTVYVTAPNIVEIYSNTEQTIRSNGTLRYPMLRLYSMDFFGGVGTGDFIMDVENGQLVVQSSHVSAFFITGRTNQMLLNFYNGTGRFEGADFLADEIIISHRGSNDMIVHPVEILSGNIYSTGNVRSVTHPGNVDISEHYTGRLIFE